MALRKDESTLSADPHFLHYASDTGQRKKRKHIAHPLISIIIANYKQTRYLPGAIDSVLKQNYSHIEINSGFSILQK